MASISDDHVPLQEEGVPLFCDVFVGTKQSSKPDRDGYMSFLPHPNARRVSVAPQTLLFLAKTTKRSAAVAFVIYLEPGKMGI